MALPPLWFIGFILLLLGILMLRYSIRQLLKWTGSSVLFTLPPAQSEGSFTVTKIARYSIWQTRKTYGQAALAMPTPVVASIPAGKRLPVNQTFSNVRVSGFGEGRFQLFTFWAQPGDYQLKLPPTELGTVRPYGLEIREYRPTYQMVFAILLTIFGGFFFIGGVVLLIRAIFY